LAGKKYAFFVGAGAEFFRPGRQPARGSERATVTPSAAFRPSAVRKEEAMWRRSSWLAVLVLVCGAANADEAHQYTVDATRSDIHWLVFKAGSLSRLGHNHVIAAAELTGHVIVNDGDESTSRFELEFPVQALVVDDPKLRSGLGEDFSSVPSANDIAGTRKNMLGDRVLDSEHHKTIRVTGTGPTGQGEGQNLKVTVELLGRSVELTVPTKVTMDGDRLTATGEFELTHTKLGMMPFTVMLGALQVADNMKFVYHVEAAATQSQN
jgi:hypothetical protein